MNQAENNHIAGPSRLQRRSHDQQDSEYMEIASTGLEFFEYRRRLFLANLPIPMPSGSGKLPETYRVSIRLPDPLPYNATPPAPSSSVGRLEALLSEPGAEGSEAAWNSGVAGVAKNLSGGKRLAKRLRLGLVIKILRAGWLRDGTWPIDPETAKAAVPPPDSPTSDTTPIFHPNLATLSGATTPQSSNPFPSNCSNYAKETQLQKDRDALPKRTSLRQNGKS